MTRYVLTIEEASQLFAEAGVPRAPRSITRFCALGDLDCIRVDTEKNYKYLIDRTIGYLPEYLDGITAENFVDEVGWILKSTFFFFVCSTRFWLEHM